MAQSFTQEIFELRPLIKSIDIKLCTHNRNGVKQILALITQDNEIVLYYTYGELPAIIKIIPWFTDSSKDIQALCFDPTATWLFVVCLDSSSYIVPALHIADKKQKIDCKWSLSDITAFPKSVHNSSNSLPTSCVWWQTLDCNQNALIGFNSGKILLISLTDGKVLGDCEISEAVLQLHVAAEKEVVTLLINGNTERQWTFLLEYYPNCYTWPMDISKPDDFVKSKLVTLRQIGVDTFVSLRDKIILRRDTQNESDMIECSDPLTFPKNLNIDENLMYSRRQPNLPHPVDLVFTPQTCKNQNFFSVLNRSTGLLTVHSTELNKSPVYIYRVLARTHSVLLTENLIFTLNRDINVISILSSQLAESRSGNSVEVFNEDSLLAQFMIDNEEILNIFQIVNMTSEELCNKQVLKSKFIGSKLNKSDFISLSSFVDTCLIVTNKTVYKIFVRHSPIQRSIEYVTEENDLEKAEKICSIFNFNLPQLLEHCGDLMLTEGSFHSGIILYKQAKVHLLKRVLKLAVTADCKTLLKFVHLCLNASRIDMNITTRLHIGNVAVMAYVELLLRGSSNEKINSNNIKDFMKFLIHESHFDSILAVNILCRAGHWNIVNLLSKSKGLQPEVVVAFSTILHNDLLPKPPNIEFLYALSEPSLTQSLLVFPQNSQVIFQYIRENVDLFPKEILKRFVIQLDPSQSCAIPYLKSIYQNNSYSSTDTNLDSCDFEAAYNNSVIIIKDFVETFLFVILSLNARSSNISFNLDLLDILVPDNKQEDYQIINRLPDLRLLSCGYEHAAVIRNKSVYTMGVATSGCLGTGPVLANTSGPHLVNILHDLKVTPLSVSCGRKHTLCATDCGVFVWGSNSHGQLGMGSHLEETPYPQLISSIAHLKIVDVSAGQYHSLALTISGQVYSWGWGIHGQLGHNCCDNEYYPRLIDFEFSVKQIAAGHAHSLILTTSGKIYGFGSNVFGQLEGITRIEMKKCTIPLWIRILDDIHVPVEKIATSYFYNMAIITDQTVYMWGASPEEVRCFQQKLHQKQNNGNNSASDTWEPIVLMYRSKNRRPIKQISVGYRHCAILDQGKLLWGKNKQQDLWQPNIRDPIYDSMGYRFGHISCGLDYTMAIDQHGQVFAWGTPAMIETILGISVDAVKKKQEDRAIIFKGTKRSFKPSHLHPISDNFPIEISVLPPLNFTFNQINHKMLLANKYIPNNILLLENANIVKIRNTQRNRNNSNDFEHIYTVPDVKVGETTLHYTLQSFIEFYDIENILKKSLDLKNFQAASKVAFLHGHFVDSLGFSIEGFKCYIDEIGVDLMSLFTCKDSYDVREKDQGIEIIVKTIRGELEKDKSSSSSSPARILSSSSSLDSLKHFGEEGGQESPCESDIRQNISNYVESVNRNDSSAFVPKLNDKNYYKDLLSNKNKIQLELHVKNKQAKELLDFASRIVEFYIEKIYISENHILMQNILLKCIEFWLVHNLPIIVLENILLKNLDKYFYPLSILLFCKNFEDDDVISCKDGGNNIPVISSSRFLREFSTKFCLHLCSMVLENTDKV